MWQSPNGVVALAVSPRDTWCTLNAYAGFALLVALFPLTPSVAADARMLETLAQPGHVVLLRHALAPGTGDPARFELGDCSTQRNLDDTGRVQARAIGERLRAAGVGVAAVYSSQWCRCLETARLLNLGEPTPLPALNSFFEDRHLETSRTDAMRAFLAALPRDAGLRVFVTHQVNITALTGESVASGEMKILSLDAEGRYTLVGSLDAAR